MDHHASSINSMKSMRNYDFIFTVSTIVNRAQKINCYDFKPCHHINRDMEPYIRLSFFTLFQLQSVLIPLWTTYRILKQPENKVFVVKSKA